MGQEIELRFSADPNDLSRLSQTSAFPGFAVSRSATRRLSSVYYDTPDLGFAKVGLAVRVRKEGGRHVQTVKDEDRGVLASERSEFEAPLPTSQPDLRFVPDPEIREKLQDIANGVALEPIIETEIRRTTRSLKTDAGDEIELAVDRGEIRTFANGKPVIPVSEIELELKHGQASALYDVARRLSHAAPLVIAPESKAERGLRALKGHEISTHKAGVVELAPDCSAEDAFRATLAHCLRHIARNVSAVADARDPEGIHQLRVGLRRLRVAMWNFGPAFRAGALIALRERAKTLAKRLGATRELDVFADELLKPIEEASDRPGLAQLRRRLEALRRQSWDGAVDLVCSPAFTGFLLDLADAIQTSAWRKPEEPEQLSVLCLPARDVARHTLDDRLKKACKRAKHLASMTPAERHRLRISLKKLRYMAEFFAPLWPAKSVTPFLQRLSKLQDLFGALNDAATAEHTLRRIAEHGRGGPALREAAAFVEGWHQSRVEPTWKQAKKRWKRFARTVPFWRQ